MHKNVRTTKTLQCKTKPFNIKLITWFPVCGSSVTVPNSIMDGEGLERSALLLAANKEGGSGGCIKWNMKAFSLKSKMLCNSFAQTFWTGISNVICMIFNACNGTL